MRHTSRLLYLRPTPNMLRLPSEDFTKLDEAAKLSAFRGLLIAASASALFWGAFVTIIWLVRSKG